MKMTALLYYINQDVYCEIINLLSVLMKRILYQKFVIAKLFLQ